MPEKEKSVTWIIAMVMILILAFGWCFSAAAYAHEKEHWGSGAGRGALAAFIANGFGQLSNLPAVVAFTFTDRLWMALTIIGLEVGAVLGGIKMKQLEKELSSPGRRRR